MDFLYNFFQTCDRSHYFKGITAIDRLILCTISFKLVISPIISKELLRSISLFSVQFLSNLRIGPIIFKGIIAIDRLILCTISFKLAIGPIISKGIIAIDRLILCTISGDLRSIGPNFQRNWVIDHKI
jgi:hypothetical protein